MLDCKFLHAASSGRLDTSYWTSGSKSNQGGKFYWCSTEKFFDPWEVNWASGYPKAGEDCAFYELNPSTGKPEIKSGKCADEKLFVCDVIYSKSNLQIQA